MVRDSLRRESRSSGRWMALLLVGGLALGLAGCGKSPEERLVEARASIDEKNYAEAVVELKNVLQENPDVRDARLMLAEASFAVGDPRTADKELKRAEDLGADRVAHQALHYRIQLALGNFDEVSVSLVQPGGTDGLTPAEAATFQGNAQLGKGDSTAAEASFRAALAEDPEYADAKVGLASALQSLGRTDEMTAVVAELVERHPEQPSGWLMRGQMAMSEGRLEAARDDFLQAVTAARELPDRVREYIALNGLAEMQIGLQDLDGAKASVKDMRRLAPGSPLTLKMSAKMHYANQEFVEARRDLQKVLAGNGDDISALYLLGAVYLSEGSIAQADANEVRAEGNEAEAKRMEEEAKVDFAQAETNLKRVVALAPANMAARKLLANVQLRSENPGAAAETLPDLSEMAGDQQAAWLKGQALLLTGETDEAISVLEQSHAADPDNVEVAMILGRAYLSQRRLDDAVNLFESIPESDDYRRDLLLAITYDLRGESEQAQGQIDRILADHPEDNNALILVAEYFIATGRSAQAKAYLEQVVARDPENIRARIGLARVSIAAGDRAETRRIMEGVLEDDPDNVQARLMLGNMATGEQRYQEAREYLEPAIADAPNAVDAKGTLAIVYVRLGQHAEATGLAAEALEQAPDNPRVLLVNGIVAFEAGNDAFRQGKDVEGTSSYNESLRYLSTLTNNEPDSAEGWFHLARTQLAMDDNAAGRASVDTALELAPTYLQAGVLNALLLSVDGEYDAALAETARLQGVYPDVAAPYVAEGQVLMAAERYAEAADALERGYALQPTAPVVIQIHLARVESGGDAIDLLEAWLADHPNDQAVSLIIADYRQQSGDNEAAIDVYERAIEVDGNNAVALNNMAWLLHDQGDGRAEDLARRAHGLRPDLPQIKDTLGWILVSNGQLEEGRRLLEEADAALPNNADIRYHLAVALEKSGEREKSSEMLREILANDQEFESRADAEQMLAEMSAQ